MQAGLLAGMSVAATFFAIDLARGTPLSTPLFLSRSMLEALLAVSGEGLTREIEALSLGGRLATFTAVHLAFSAVLGMLAAALANLFHVHWSARTGAVAGFLLGSGAWVGAAQVAPVWLTEARFLPEIVIGTGMVGGAVLGWHLRLCRMDAEEDRNGPAR